METFVDRTMPAQRVGVVVISQHHAWLDHSRLSEHRQRHLVDQRPARHRQFSPGSLFCNVQPGDQGVNYPGCLSRSPLVFVLVKSAVTP